jgi:hypothetical protein
LLSNLAARKANDPKKEAEHPEEAEHPRKPTVSGEPLYISLQTLFKQR